MRTKLLVLFLAEVGLYAQPWSTFLDPSRAVDWSNSNITWTIPNYTVNCATQPVLTPNDVTAGAANTMSIQNALNSCDATHNVVNIPAGTFYVAGITFGMQGSQVLRGAGTRATTVIMSDQSPCGGLFLGICMIAGNPQSNGSAPVQPGGAQACAWTAGYAKGTTSITLNNCGSAPPLNSILILDQANDTTDTNGIFVCDPSVDNFNMAPRNTPVAVCAPPNNQSAACAVGCTVGFYEQGNVNHNGRTIGGIAYSQQQEVIITGVTGTGTGPYTVTISNGVFPNNIRASQTPGAWWFLPTQQVSHDGTENLTVVHGVSAVFLSSLTGFAPGNYLLGATSGSTAYITRIGQFSQSVQFAAQQGGQFVVSETIQQTATRGGPPTGVSATNNANTNQGGVSTAVAQFSCYQCWERNVRSENAGQQHAFIYQSYQSVIRDSYFFAAQAHGTQSYGLEVTASSNALIENNIFQQNTNCVLLSNSSGSVVDYNYSVFEGFQNANGTPNPFLIGADAHNAGHTMNLWEGNNFSVIWSDIYWGPGSTGTLFRNMLRGWEPGKTRTTNPMRNGSKIRVFNVVGNVLGQPLYHMHYQSNATSTTAGVNGDATNAANVSIYSLGWSGNTGDAGCNFPPTCDPLTTSTLMRWGNYTTVGPGDTPAQVTFDSTEASPAAVPFANANFTPAYFSSLSHALPASLYYTSRPSWWPTSKAFPPIGPDVTSGNLGTCAAGVFMGAQAITATQCASDLTPQYAGHATSIPAQDCYLNIMGGPPDGSGNVLNFDANVCYYAAAPITPPAPPTGLTAQILFPILGGGNPASRFNCASISGCVLWYRSDSTSGNGPQCSGSPCANGAQVTAWIDSSPSHNNAGPITPNSGCTYATALLNGHGGVFSPNFTSPACTMPITTPVAWNVSYTVFAVFRPTGGVTTTNPVLSGAPGVTMPSYRFTSSTGNQAIVKPGAANVIAGTLPLVSGTFHQGNASYNSTTTAASLRLNRALDNSAATTSSGSTTGSLNSILGESSPALPLQGNVLEIIVYIPQLSTTDITTVETYLNQKYGI